MVVPRVASEGGMTDTHELKPSLTKALGSKSVCITLQDVSYYVKDSRKGENKGKPLYLLKGVSTLFEPGRMSALMGPSGSGKTTLLDVLAGRKTVGTAEGTILFGGIAPTLKYLRRFTGYVEQFDTLLGILTVHEMLMYTAELKRPMHESLSRKQEEVEALMERLNLNVCRNVKIGSALVRGISGGQAKRVNIGIALITDPRILFLDEPTTGLDSFTSNEVMTLVKGLVRESGITCVSTIHSPTAYTFSLFDEVTMLVGGRLVWNGLGREAVPFFQASGLSGKEHKEGDNSAEFLVDIITEADRFGRGGALADAYEASQQAMYVKQRLNDQLSNIEDVPESVLQELKASLCCFASPHPGVTSSTVTPMWWGIRTLVKYRTSRNYRDPAFLAPRILDKMIIGLLVMTLYLNVGREYSVDNIINIAAILFMWNATTGFVAASYIPSLVLERSLFIRERADDLTSKMLDELMINFVASCFISAFVFYGIKLQAYFVAAFAPNMDAANAILPIYAVTLLFFAGFLIRLDDLPPWWKWYSYINFARYAWGATMINQFEHNDVMYIGGMTVLEYFGFDGVRSKWTNVGFVALFFIFFFCSTWATLQWKNYANR
ncbi:hypothetical protein QJQ45_027319 [Haematococcus lacustris]|nr:hypothetical protein QJQ45_027319 [Haematococcus lacustris]